MSTEIIELSSFNSSEKNSDNSVWGNTFAPITIGTGDEIVLKTGYIDTRNSNAFGNITIEEDITLDMEFGFYINYISDYNLTGYPTASYSLPNYEPHVARIYETTPTPNLKLIKGTKSLTVTAGTYSPNVLAELISTQMSKITSPTLGSYLDLNNGFLKNSTPIPQVYIQNMVFDAPVGSTKDVFFFTSPLDSITLSYFNPGDMVDISFTWLIDFETWPVEIDTITSTQIKTKFPYAAPDPNFVMSNIVLRQKVPTPAPVFFYRQEPVTPLIQDTPYITIDLTIPPKGPAPSRFYGASEMSLIFNDEDKRFEWSYMHSPYYVKTADNVNESVGFDLSRGQLFSVESQSGIFFTKLEPVSFWGTTLGFDLSKLVLTDDGTKLNSTLQIGTNITSNYFGLTNMFDHDAKMNVPTEAFYSISTQTNGIQADNQYESDVEGGGYFLLSIDNLQSPSKYSEDRNQRNNIMAIVSRQYNENGYISDWGSGSLRFVNTGAPYLLTNAKVSILDPLTKNAVGKLGPNSSLFLEVAHNNQIMKK